MVVRRFGNDDAKALQSALDLIQREFEYMDGVVDPPSSAHRLTVDELASGPGEVWGVGTPLRACVVMTPRTDVLYIGKLAVASTERNRGLARLLVDQADIRARELGVSWVELQTRIELEANHRAFTAMGFIEIEQTAHPGYDRPTSITYRRAV